MTNQELAKRAYACPGWQWMQGIMTELLFDDDGKAFPCPDFTSPATLGCLHAMVKQATGCAYSFDVSADFLIAALEEAK